MSLAVVAKSQGLKLFTIVIIVIKKDTFHREIAMGQAEKTTANSKSPFVKLRFNTSSIFSIFMVL